MLRYRSEGFHAWTEHEIEVFEVKWPVGTNERLGFDLLLYTAQRSGDVRQMTVHQIRDGPVLVRQEKTGQLVDIPQHPNLQASLTARKIEHLALLTTQQGKPFTEKGFGNWVSKAAERAGLPHCSAQTSRLSARRLRENDGTVHATPAPEATSQMRHQQSLRPHPIADIQSLEDGRLLSTTSTSSFTNRSVD